MLGSWVRAPSGSPTKRQVLQNQYFVGLFLLPFGDLDRQKKGIDGHCIKAENESDTAITLSHGKQACGAPYIRLYGALG